MFVAEEGHGQVAESSNAAARMVTGTRKISAVCHSWQMHDDLNWLVIPQRGQYKREIWRRL